jgi:pSer/pThr/pTyr-binding forkhead associated (FHA) protein
MQDHGGQTAEISVPESEPETPDWVESAREALPGPGRYLAYRDDDEVRVVRLEEGWTRVGRSAAADLRLEDPSVSRRHAMIACEPPKALRILDDRSLNGVRVNGEAIEWSRLGDGDELTIGRFRLFVLAP